MDTRSYFLAMSIRYNLIKEPKVGDGPSRLVGRYTSQEEAERIAKIEGGREENRAYRFGIELDEDPAE